MRPIQFLKDFMVSSSTISKFAKGGYLPYFTFTNKRDELVWPVHLFWFFHLNLNMEPLLPSFRNCLIFLRLLLTCNKRHSALYKKITFSILAIKKVPNTLQLVIGSVRDFKYHTNRRSKQYFFPHVIQVFFIPNFVSAAYSEAVRLLWWLFREGNTYLGGGTHNWN